MNNQQDHRWKYNNDKEQGIVQKKNRWTVNSKDQKETKNHTINNKKNNPKWNNQHNKKKTNHSANDK